MTIGTVAPNVFDRMSSAWRAFKAAPNPASLYPVARQNSGIGYLSFPGWGELEKHAPDQSRDEARARLAVTSPWVFSDITAIANEASVAVLQVKQRDATDEGESDIENHPLELLWEAPNPFMGRMFLVSFWIWQRLLSGKAFLYWVPKTDGTVGEVWPVPSFMLSPIPDAQRFISGYVFKSGPQATPIRIDAKYITYSRLPHPFDIRDGLSPLAAIFTEIEADLAMANWNKSFFSKENAAPSGLITVSKDTLDGDLARVRMEIMDFFGGQSGRRVGVARAGDMDWKPFDRSQKDMEFLEGRSFSRSAIDRVFGFPEGYWSKDATRANSEGAKATMIENAVWPHLVALAEDLNAQTLPQWFGKDVRATFDDIRPRNRALELQEFTAYSTVLTVDELRAKIGDKPIGDVRGKMLISEANKGTPIPATPASDETEEKIAAMEEDAGVDTPAPEDAPALEDTAQPEEAAPPEEAGADVFSKSVGLLLYSGSDLDRWERKALKALRNGKGAAVPFSSDAIDADTHARISEALRAAQTPTAVKAAFNDLDAVMSHEDAAAREWAKKVLGDA